MPARAQRPYFSNQIVNVDVAHLILLKKNADALKVARLDNGLGKPA